MRPSISKSDIEEAHRVHKKLLTTFEIAAPTVLPKDISNNVIFRMDLGKHFIRVSKHKKDELKNVQKFYEAMKSNYEIEFGDLIKFSDPSLVYLIMCTTIEKGLTTSSASVASCSGVARSAAMPAAATSRTRRAS